MAKYSSKRLNLMSLDAIIKASSSADSVLLLTNFGVVIGELDSPNDDTSNLSKTIADTKNLLIDELESIYNEPIELIDDGSSICVKNAIVKYSSNFTLNFKELFIHSSDICGFTPIKKNDVLNQL